MANVFEIKYLYELYPDINFSEDFVTEQIITETYVKYESEATSKAWGDLKDSIHAKRLIQTYKKRHYEVKIKISRNIDVARLSVGYVTLTTTDSEVFTIYDVKTTFEKIANSLNYMLVLDFFRYDDDIINHLSSDNCLIYKAQTLPVIPVNELSFNVIKPSYIVRANIIASATYYQFTVPLTSELSQVLVSNYYYGHVKDTSFPNNLHYELNVTAVSATEITFRFNQTTISGDFGYSDIVINQEADELTASTNVYNNSLTHSFTIYTFINPKIYSVDTPTDGISTEDGINEDQKFNHKNKASFKIWLTTAELYKIEFLNYAKAEDILLTLADDTEYIPCQVQGIYKYVPKDALIDLHEFDIELLYLNKTVNIYR